MTFSGLLRACYSSRDVRLSH